MSQGQSPEKTKKMLASNVSANMSLATTLTFLQWMSGSLYTSVTEEEEKELGHKVAN